MALDLASSGLAQWKDAEGGLHVGDREGRPKLSHTSRYKSTVGTLRPIKPTILPVPVERRKSAASRASNSLPYAARDEFTVWKHGRGFPTSH
jgi:hypothetical protein